MGLGWDPPPPPKCVKYSYLLLLFGLHRSVGNKMVDRRPLTPGGLYKGGTRPTGPTVPHTTRHTPRIIPRKHARESALSCVLCVRCLDHIPQFTAIQLVQYEILRLLNPDRILDPSFSDVWLASDITQFLPYPK